MSDLQQNADGTSGALMISAEVDEELPLQCVTK